ncbi:MAG: hypothetical protein NTW91_02975 [Verrucomicrobia bacterium]|nr:hypothetical protein [Verrucomicrobiota bacterium]
MSLNQRFLQPRVLIRIGLLLLLLVGIELWFLNSKGHNTAVHKRSSEKFGEALQRIGIETQPGPSK